MLLSLSTESPVMSSEQLSVSLIHMESPITVRKTIGKNVRRIRMHHGVVADQLAGQMQSLGFKWTASRVSEVERGQKPVSIEEMICLAYSLGVATGSGIRLADLWEGDFSVEISEQIYWKSGHIAELFKGRPVYGQQRSVLLPDIYGDGTAFGGLKPGLHVDLDIADRERMIFGVAEKRAQKKFGLTEDELRDACAKLWGRSLSTERDRRSHGGSAQKKGHITRELMQELESYLESHHGND